MRYSIVIAENEESVLRAHLFQGGLEQGAFLFAHVLSTPEEVILEVVDAYLIPPEGWLIQSEVYLEMNDAERAKIMKKARDRGVAVVECHSHPGSEDAVCFSLSDQKGIAEFALYAKWKLDGKPYAAMVWGECSVDAVIWLSNFAEPHKVNEVCIIGKMAKILVPRNTWFQRTAFRRGRK